MTQADLFTPTPTPNHESKLAESLAQSAHDDLITIARQGRIAPYIELEQWIAKDDLRFLRLIEEHSGYVVPDTMHTVEYGSDRTGLLAVPVTRRVDHLTYVLGFNSPGNCAACINRSLERGWVIESICQLTGRVRYDLGELGRYALDLKERDEWFERDR